MKYINPKSLFVIVFYSVLNLSIIWLAYEETSSEMRSPKKKSSVAPEFTEIYNLDYYHLKKSVPSMSLAAEKMRSRGEVSADFDSPKGIYHYREKNQVINYQGNQGVYRKNLDLLALMGDVKLTSDGSVYSGKEIQYFFKKDLIEGKGGVQFKGVDPKSQDKINIVAETMRANPQTQFSRFNGGVKGSMERKKKYEGQMTFSAQQLDMDGLKSLAHLEGNVEMKRDNYFITSGKADITMENYNKSLKYFVLNDDVKVTETLQTAQGKVQRKAFAERLEGFGREEKMVLSGAPRVEQGEDVVKGYKITIREKLDLIEVDDAMSDMNIKKEKKKKN